GGPTHSLAADGSIVGQHYFTAWGERAIDSDTDPYSGYGSQWGYRSDWETGLQLCGERYYDAANGRFLNRDPIGDAGGVNLYSYCANGPTNYADPDGTKVIPPSDSDDNDAYNEAI